MTLFCISAVLVLIAAAGIVDAAMPDDAYWSRFFEGDGQ